jgi:hypothetical protein
MTAPVLRANTELVAVAWLAGVPGLSASIVASRRPSDNSTWAASGFVTVRPLPGGVVNVDVPLRSPAVTVECWAVNPSSNRPPKGKAANLGEAVWAAVTPTTNAARAAIRRRVQLPGDFPDAFVHSVYPLGELRPAYGEQGGFAHYLLDLAFVWTEVP